MKERKKKKSVQKSFSWHFPPLTFSTVSKCIILSRTSILCPNDFLIYHLFSIPFSYCSFLSLEACQNFLFLLAKLWLSRLQTIFSTKNLMKWGSPEKSGKKSPKEWIFIYLFISDIWAFGHTYYVAMRPKNMKPIQDSMKYSLTFSGSRILEFVEYHTSKSIKWVIVDEYRKFVIYHFHSSWIYFFCDTLSKKKPIEEPLVVSHPR